MRLHALMFRESNFAFCRSSHLVGLLHPRYALPVQLTNPDVLTTYRNALEPQQIPHLLFAVLYENPLFDICYAGNIDRLRRSSSPNRSKMHARY